jgi:predicted PhzF superfamily epimerase YddE/YHI9
VTAKLHVLRVFCDEEGRFGNPLGVFLDGAEVAEERRQAVAKDLNFSETVFVDDREAARIRIFTPGMELQFAGHPTVGTAWLLHEEGEEAEVLRPPAGEVVVRRAGEGEESLTFVTARAQWGPPWDLVQLPDAAAVEALPGSPDGREDDVCTWAWVDEEAGTVRSRCFAVADGIPEDEATGSAAICLAAALGRQLLIDQGEGSLLRARALGTEDWAEVGGRVVLDEVRDYEV